MTCPAGRRRGAAGGSRRWASHLGVAVAALAVLAVCDGQRPAPVRRAQPGDVARTGALAKPSAVALRPDGDGSGRSGRYLVVLADGPEDVGARAAQLARRHGGELRHVYRHALKGFAARMPHEKALALGREPGVRWIEEDAEAVALDVQDGATWGLDRIHQRALPLDLAYVYGATGAGVSAYVIDTGIRASHAEFGGRALPGFDAVGDGLGTDDCNGHGTHVAGTIGGATYGVAKQVQLYAVRVLDCGGSGSYSGVIAGIDWVVAHHAGPSVANMSLGGPSSATLDAAVSAAVASGVTIAVAAGNSADDACWYSPAREPAAITVGASTSEDATAYFTNLGACVDVFAPGLGVTSAWSADDGATAVLSGTSMATPHVTGAAALLLEARPGATPAAIHDALQGLATMGALADLDAATQNLLLYSGFIATGPPAPAEPAVAITGPASGTPAVGVVTLSAEASDARGVNQVAFLVDGAVVGRVAGPPWTLAWDSTSARNGEHALVARAYAETGNAADSAPTALTVDNPVRQVTLTVVVQGPGSGSVSGGGIACSTGATSGCSAQQDQWSVVTLEAVPADGALFTGWSGACTGLGACEVTMASDEMVAARFEPAQYRLTVNVSGPGAGTVSGVPGLRCRSGSGDGCSVLLENGATVALAEAPDDGSIFKAWGGACSGSGACQVTMSSDRAVTARFESATYPLLVLRDGTGPGTVAGVAEGTAQGWTCDLSAATSCTWTAPNGATVLASASPGSGMIFKRWSGACTGAGACRVSMYDARSLSARFEPETFPLDVTFAGTGQGKVTGAGLDCGTDGSLPCSVSVANGTVVSLEAAPLGGAVFEGWGLVCTGTGACQVTLNTARTVSARFGPATYPLGVALTGGGAGKVTGSGIDCGMGATACTAAVANGGTFALTAALPADGSAVFKGWSGAGCSGTSPGCSGRMSAAATVTARFEPAVYRLTVTTSGMGSGTVTSTVPAGALACAAGQGASCTLDAANGSTVVLAAAPGADALFKGWSGACSGTGTCAVAMTAARSVGATFEPAAYPLTVALAGTGQGLVTGAGLRCGSDGSLPCSVSVPSGATVSLAATPIGGARFEGWGLVCAGTGTCQLTMNAAMTVSARFGPATYPLGVSLAGGGAGKVTGSGIDCGMGATTCTADVANGASFALTAVLPADGSAVFKGWSGGGCSGTSLACTAAMSAATTVTARFEPALYRLTVTLSGAGNGSVTSTAPAGGLACSAGQSAPCTLDAANGSTVVLAAAPGAQSLFKGWSGACAGTGTCAVAMTAARSVGATFEPAAYPLTVTFAGTGQGLVTGGGLRCGTDGAQPCTVSIPSGTTVSLSAAPLGDSTFQGWGLVCTGTGTCLVRMNAARTVSARFAPGTYRLTVLISGTGSGTVTGGGMACRTAAAPCSASEPNGASVPLTATPDAGSTFAGWTGSGCSGTTATCWVAMSSDRNVAATFTRLATVSAR